MSNASLEERVAALETRVDALENAMRTRAPSRDDWKSGVGMFRDDPFIHELHEAARRIREDDRRATGGDE